MPALYRSSRTMPQSVRTAPRVAEERRAEEKNRVRLLESPGFVLMHLACLLVLWVGVSWVAVAVCVAMYFVRMFGITAGYHRYFSHRSYKTSRVFQFALAWLGASAAQQGPLWWAAHHRHHHRHPDADGDIHSPVLHGFWWSHVGWLLSPKYKRTRVELVPDLAKFRELRFINRFYLLPPALLAVALFLLGLALGRYYPAAGTSGAQMLVWGFVVSTVVLYHGTFTVNSLAHVFGRRRFDTRDNSRNSFLVSFITLGEGWHNNHHFFPASERQGFYWWELDVSHYILRALACMGVVWSLRTPPADFRERLGFE
jgi:stearoyl-CoA desaturase (delta-9 desaturase)